MTPQAGIILDAESIRSEIYEAPLSHNLSTADVSVIAALPDDVINAALRKSVDRDGDSFWAAYDDARRRAIAHLVDDVDADDA